MVIYRRNNSSLNSASQATGDQASKLIVVEAAYETNSPRVDSQVVQIKAQTLIFLNIGPGNLAGAEAA